MIRPKTSDTGRRWPGSAVKTPRSGFTLVEVLVVISITALLLSILVPFLRKAKSMAMRVRCAHNLKQIHIAVNLYLSANEQTYPCAEDPLTPDYWLWMGRGWRSFVEPHLSTKIDKDNPSVLFCPQDRIALKRYEATSYAYSMSFYHSPQQIDTMSSINDQWDGTSLTSTPQRSFDVANPSGKILIGEWFSHHLHISKGNDKGWWCWEGQRNYLFVDGQVSFLRAKDIREANDGLPNPNLTIHGIKGLDWPTLK